MNYPNRGEELRHNKMSYHEFKTIFEMDDYLKQTNTPQNGINV
jgi:hypothetical protein